MAADPYQTLGVKKDASQDAIQKAYRRLAKKLHPDLNPGNEDRAPGDARWRRLPGAGAHSQRSMGCLLGIERFLM